MRTLHNSSGCSRGRGVVCSANDRRTLNAFVQWAIERKVQFGGLRPDSKDGYRGLFATTPISAAQPLVAVPRTSCISLTTSEPPPPALQAGRIQQVWQQLPWWARLAVKLCLLAEQDGKAMGPYLDVLPQPHEVDLPALWCSSPGDARSEAPMRQQGANGDVSSSGSAADPVAELQLPYIIVRVREEQRQWQSIVSQLEPLLATHGVTRGRLLWALAVVRSRSFEAPTFKVPTVVKTGLAAALPLLALAAEASSGALAAGPAALLDLDVLAPALASLSVPAALTSWDLKNSGKETTFAIPPFLDFLNHRSNAQTEVGYDWVRDVFYVSSGAFYQPGNQVLISYGDLSNDALLTLYGFVEPDNEHDRYIMSDLAKWLTTSTALQQAAAGSTPPTGPTASTTGDTAGAAPAGASSAAAALVAAAERSALVAECALDASGAACTNDMAAEEAATAATQADAAEEAGSSASTARQGAVAASGSSAVAAPELPEWKARALREAVKKLGGGGLLSEVEVRRSGFPAEVMEACLALSRLALRLRRQARPDEDLGGYEPSQASVVALTAQTLSGACAEELEALGSTMEQDEAALQRAKLMLQLTSQPAPSAPTLPTAPVAPSPPTPQQQPAESSSGSEPSSESSQLLQSLQEHIAAAGTTGSAAAVAAAAVAVLSSSEEEQERLQEYQRQLERYEAELERYNVEIQRYELLSRRYREQLGEWEAARAVGAVALGRRRLAVEYRLEKKRVLVGGMGAVVEWMRGRLGR